MRRGGIPALVCCAATIAGGKAGAVPLLNGFGGVDGYGTPDHCVAAGNDNSYAAPGSAEPAAIALAPAFPERLFFFDAFVDHFYLNTNGTITFAVPLATPSPIPFPVAGQPMLAPWWADVDTRAGGTVCYDLEPNRLVATWHDVGYFDGHADRRNDFQLILSMRPLCDAPGNFDVEFRYNRCEWVNGDGALPAQVGFDAGNGRNFVALPQSRTAAIADVCRTSNVPGGEPGLYRFQVRSTILIACSRGGERCTIAGRSGACANGVITCDREGPVCFPLAVPRAPACDGFDNDCDGRPDDGDSLCRPGTVCDLAAARCLPRCDAGRCPAGTTCTAAGGCVEDECRDVTCPQGQRCNAGSCVGLCDGVECGPSERCERGRCVAACERVDCDRYSVCDDSPGSSSLGQCISRCECSPCRAGRVCAPDGRCVLPPPPDAGAPPVDAPPIDAAAVDIAPPDVVPTPDAGTPGRLVDAGCGCRAVAPPSGVPLALFALAALATTRRRRRPLP